MLEENYFHYIFPRSILIERNGGLHFLQVVARKKSFQLLYFSITEININF